MDFRCRVKQDDCHLNYLNYIYFNRYYLYYINSLWNYTIRGILSFVLIIVTILLAANLCPVIKCNQHFHLRNIYVKCETSGRLGSVSNVSGDTLHSIRKLCHNCDHAEWRTNFPASCCSVQCFWPASGRPTPHHWRGMFLKNATSGGYVKLRATETVTGPPANHF